MALNFGKGQRAIAFAPATAFPLDARSYFESYDLAVAAAAIAAEPGTDAAKNTEYYFGETLVVNEGGKATLYIIQPDKTLKEVGSVPVGDGKSIEVVNGQIKLKGFGSGYYQYNKNYDPESTEEGKKDQYIFVEEGFKAGLQPQVVAKASGEGFEIAWYEPNPTTVEGLQAQITALDGSVNNLTNKVDKKADASSLDLYQKQAISSISGYASASTVEGALAEVMSQAMTNAGGITAVEGRVATAEGSINTMQSVLNAVSGTYATKTEVNALSTVYETISNVDTKLANYYTSAQADAKFETIANVNSKLADYYTKQQADKKHEEVVEIAQGKTQTFVVDYEDNEFLNSKDAEVNVQQFITIDGKAIAADALKVGDVILVVQTDVPDRWVKEMSDRDDFVLAALETTKVDLEPYATRKYVDEEIELVSNMFASYATTEALNEAIYDLSSDLSTEISDLRESVGKKITSIEGWAASTISTKDIEKWNKAEENAYNSAVVSASAMVAEEAGVRESADNALSARIDAEAATRLKDDQALDARISALEGKPFDTYATKSELDAEAKTRKDADDALDVRLDAVEAQLGISDESGNSLTEKVSEIIKEVWGVSTIENFDFKASSEIDNLKEGVSGVLNEITSIKTNYATEIFVGEAIEAASHINTVNAVNSAYVTATANEDKSVSIGVTDKLKSVIDNAATSVSGGQYVSGSISKNKLTIDDSNLVSAINGLNSQFLSIDTDYIENISFSEYINKDSLRSALVKVIHGNGDTDSINLTEKIFGTSGIVDKAATIMVSQKVAGNLYALGENLGEGSGENAGILLSNLVAKGHASELASGIIAAVDWVSSNKDVVSNLDSHAVTNVQTSTLVMTHSGNNLTIDLPSVIWLDGGSASDTYEAEEAVYNELLNNEYGN